MVVWLSHRHGIRQLRTGWADGPAYITQCPIRGGQSYTYKFSVIDQRGTLLWHAHSGWQRASVHGVFIIYPRMPYPFSAPIKAEIPIIFGKYLYFFFASFDVNFLFFFLFLFLFVFSNCLLGLNAGEWWNGDVDAVEDEMMLYGGGPNSSDAYTINGLPGPLYPCSNKGKIGVS